MCPLHRCGYSLTWLDESPHLLITSNGWPVPTKVWDFLINTSQDSFLSECRERSDAAFLRCDTRMRMCPVCVVWLCVCVCACCMCFHVCMCWLRLFLPRGNEVALGRGQRSIRSNPSSCQSVSPLAARCWWLPRVNAPDECPLEGKVAARKTDHRATVGRRAPNILPYTNPHCGVTLHVQYEALSATAGADSKSNGSCVALSWATGSLFPLWFSEVRDISRHEK